MKELTDKQTDVLNFIKDHKEKRGYPPTVREVAIEFQITARAAFDYIATIERKGYISRTKKISRGIKING